MSGAGMAVGYDPTLPDGAVAVRLLLPDGTAAKASLHWRDGVRLAAQMFVWSGHAAGVAGIGRDEMNEFTQLAMREAVASLNADGADA